mgnify:CR=1 FL=1
MVSGHMVNNNNNMLTAGDSEAERGGDCLAARSACYSPHRRIQVIIAHLIALTAIQVTEYALSVTLNDRRN